MKKILVWRNGIKKALKEIFAELEFRTLGKRLLGEEVETPATAASGEKKLSGKSVQIDLFGNVIGGEEPAKVAAPVIADEEGSPAFASLKKISDVPHEYIAVTGEEAIQSLVQQLSSFDEICFDTETTNIDANLAELVGMSFSVKSGEAVGTFRQASETDKILAAFKPLFDDASNMDRAKPGKHW